MALDPDALGNSKSLLAAYREGWFPMIIARPSDPKGPGAIGWCNPARRGVLQLDSFHIPTRLKRVVASGQFVVTADKAFRRVMLECAFHMGRTDTWIDDRMIRAYQRLFRSGHAHSFETWAVADGRVGKRVRIRDGMVLVGGLYGVAMGGAFFGESMFTRRDLGGHNASKVALAMLLGHLRRSGYSLCDVQYVNPHLRQFGCIEIERSEYERRLRGSLLTADCWKPLEGNLA